MRLAFALALGAAAAASVVFASNDVRACGGCFHSPTQSPDVITAHRMIFRVTPQATTLYDEIEYQGSASSFAWVLPIKGEVTIGLSSDIVFSALDQLTAPTVVAPQLPPCASCTCFDGPVAGGSGSSSGGGDLAADASAVNVISQQTVGPYESVQLQSSDPNALSNWLNANGYDIPSSLQPLVAAYVGEGFDFLALKLQPGQNVAAMRPVRVTTSGAGVQLPLRMVAAGTGSTVGITLWVVGDGRYEAQNFANFTIAASDLVWDWSNNTSNYTALRTQKEASLNNAAWQTESATQVFAPEVYQPIMYDNADMDYLPVPATDAGADGGGGSAGETADQVRDDDLATLFPGYPNVTDTDVWVTRMRGDLSHAALANDLTIQASSDQSPVSTIYQATKSVNAPACPAVPNPCPPCATGVGSSSGGTSGANGTSGNGATGNGAGPAGGGGGGCSTAMTDYTDDNVGVFLGGLAIAAVIANRAKRRKN